MTDIAITGLGAVTAVGMDAVTTGASIRAGLTRPAVLDNTLVLDLEDYKEIPVTGHPVGSLANGFVNVGRWLQLAPAALEDLCKSAALPSPSHELAFWRETTCIVALPVLGERFLPDPNCSDEQIERSFLFPLLARVDHEFRPTRTFVHARGRCGVFEAMLAARRRLLKGEFARAVILVVDSLVDLPAIQWLMETGRLKCDMNPVGLSPGESACAFMFETPGTARSRGAPLHAILKAAEIAPEPRSIFAAELSQGEALAETITAVLTSAGASPSLTIADLNGEAWRSYEFGSARTRVPRSLWGDGDVVLPVESTGDTGAATVGVQILVACRALARGYAGGNSVLVTCSDEHGAVGAAVFASTQG